MSTFKIPTPLALLGVLVLVCIVVTPGRKARAAFPGQNGDIAFVSDRSGESTDIYKMHPDGSHLRRLTDDPAEDVYPDFSPDGKQIVYVRRHSHNSGIYAMDADGSHQRRLTKKRGWELDPTFSPQGAQIVYSGERPDGSDLFVMNADGSHRHLVAHHPGNDWGAAESPLGDRIAYENTGTDISVYVMNVNGSHPRVLTDDPSDDFSFGPEFSPDGKRIAYTRVSLGFRFDIFTMNADGTDQRRLTGRRLDEGTPAFSPDGKRIVYTRKHGSHEDLYRMNADGSHPHALLRGSHNDSFPTWGPQPP